MKRRHFLRNTALLLAGSGRLAAATLSARRLRAVPPDDPRFWALVRNQFLFPDNYTYLNTGGIGAVPLPVLTEVRQRMEKAQLHPAAGHSHARWQEIKAAAAAVIGAPSSDEIALVSTATEGINIVLNGLPLRKGDEVITTAHEHPALAVPLLNRRQRDGIVIRVIEPDLHSTAGNLARIERLITRKTRLIFLSHITCTTGQRFPVREIGALARDRNILFGLDAAQAAGTGPVDVSDIGADFYTFSGHKWLLGPRRTGVLYIRRERFDTVHPVTTGAYSDDGHSLRTMDLTFQPTAQRYEYGTQNAALFEGMLEGISMIRTIGLNRVEEHNRRLAEQFYAGLQEISALDILSHREYESRSAMISFRPRTGRGSELAAELSGKRNIRVRHVPEDGLDGIRVSFHVYNTEENVDHILAAIREIVS
ncbi:aminotransferase class V-fold PLP-dependent enzyme [bacterium]|nr:aminotransferase class V-fold PLP-dependent enzyme [bacterium]